MVTATTKIWRSWCDMCVVSRVHLLGGFLLFRLVACVVSSIHVTHHPVTWHVLRCVSHVLVGPSSCMPSRTCLKSGNHMWSRATKHLLNFCNAHTLITRSSHIMHATCHYHTHTLPPCHNMHDKSRQAIRGDIWRHKVELHMLQV